MNGETAYYFQHVLLREAAYQLQPPAERTFLHGLALAILRLNPDTAPEDLLDHALECADPGCDGLLRQCVTRARARYDSAAVLRLAAFLPQVNADARTTADILWQQGVALRMQGKQAQARALLELVAAMRGDPELNFVARRASISIAEADSDAEDYEKAESAFVRLLAEARAEGDARNELTLLGNIAITHDVQKRHNQAEGEYRDALALARQRGKPREEMALLGNLGRMLLDQGRLAESRQCCEQALALSREVADQRYESFWLGWLASCDVAEGRIQEARAGLNHAMRLARAIGDRLVEANWHAELAELEQRQGNTPVACLALEVAIDMAEQAGAIATSRGWARRLSELRPQPGG